jgi:DNA-binding transcriptional ArsR family regulator
MTVPRLLWDQGTAYDLFTSLQVLHAPADFGVRGAWAAGVRARLPQAERELLEQSGLLIHVPLPWIYSLPEPKDAMTVLWQLWQVPAAERLPLLAGLSEEGCSASDVLRRVAARGSWEETDRAVVRDSLASITMSKRATDDHVETMLRWWSNCEEFGERYLESLRAYYNAFFAEEEKRIEPVLEQALARAQDLAQRLGLPDLVETLSQGLRFVELPKMAELVLVPSYWITPLILLGEVSPERGLWLFGARPDDASLVPGEAVPDAMLRALKALSDPTRLRILHYLSQEPVTPAELARRLRLRAPTVTHHLRILRLAGLVQMTLGEDDRRYAARPEAVAATFSSLGGFLGQDMDGGAGAGQELGLPRDEG